MHHGFVSERQQSRYQHGEPVKDPGMEKSRTYKAVKATTVKTASSVAKLGNLLPGSDTYIKKKWPLAEIMSLHVRTFYCSVTLLTNLCSLFLKKNHGYKKCSFIS